MAERMVTRRVIKSKEYDVFALQDGKVTKIDHIKAVGRISEKELAKAYGVDKVVTECTKEIKATYGIPVSKFMELAVEIETIENENE